MKNVTSLLKKCKMKSLAVMTSAMVLPSVAMAADKDVSTWTKSLTAQVESVKDFALVIAFLIGLVLFIFGLYGFYKDSKQPGQDHAKKGGIALLIGTLLLIVPTVIGIAGGTFGGTATESADKGTIAF